MKLSATTCGKEERKEERTVFIGASQKASATKWQAR